MCWGYKGKVVVEGAACCQTDWWKLDDFIELLNFIMTYTWPQRHLNQTPAKPRGDSILAGKQIKCFNTVIKHLMMDICGYCRILHCVLLVCLTQQLPQLPSNIRIRVADL